MTPLAPTITRELAHILRRRAPLPPLDALSEDDALRIVCAEEARRVERITVYGDTECSHS